MAEKRWRDAVTGEYVTPEYAADHPDTTVGETDHDRHATPHETTGVIPADNPSD